MARVLIADDHAMIRAGLRRWLEQDRSVEAVAEAGSGAETLQQLRDGSWDLVVLDITMPLDERTRSFLSNGRNRFVRWIIVSGNALVPIEI